MSELEERLNAIADKLNVAVAEYDKTRKGSKRHRQRRAACVRLIVQGSALSEHIANFSFYLLAWIDGDESKHAALISAGILRE